MEGQKWPEKRLFKGVITRNLRQEYFTSTRGKAQKNKVPAANRSTLPSILLELVSLRNSTCRACACTGTAIDAVISFDFVFSIAFNDSAYWTFASASTTGNTIRRNYICHDSYLLISMKINLIVLLSCTTLL